MVYVAELAARIRRLDPAAVVNPNDFGFIDGFIPWDYTRLAGFADVVGAIVPATAAVAAMVSLRAAAARASRSVTRTPA